MTTPTNDEPQPGELVEYFPLGAVDRTLVTFIRYSDCGRYAIVSYGYGSITVNRQYISRQPDIERKSE